MMKIAVFVESFPHLSLNFILDQISFLRSRGHFVKLVVYKRNIKWDKEFVFDNFFSKEDVLYIDDSKTKKLHKIIQIIIGLSTSFFVVSLFRYYSFSRINCIENIVRDSHFLFAYFRIKKVEDFDIFHVHFGSMGNYLLEFKKRGLLLKPKLVVSFHGLDLHVENFKEKYEKLFIESDIFTVNSEFSRSIVFESKIENLDKVFLLPTGLDTEFFKSKKEKKSSNSFNIFFNGRLIKLKGAEQAILIVKKLFEVVDKEEIKLIIAGDGPERDYLQNFVNKENLGNLVEFKGALSRINIRDLYAQADVFLFPAIKDPISGRSEAQGVVIQEAQAMEVPVVTSDVGGIKFGLIDQETGFLVKEGDIDEFVDKLILLKNNTELRRKMGKKGRKFVKSKFDKIILGKELELIYKSII